MDTFAWKARILTAVLLLSCFTMAQQIQQQQEVAARASTSADAKPAPKLSKEDTQLANQMLEISESTARGFEAPMRSFSLLQIAQVHVTLDRKKAIAMLKDAFTASLGIQDDSMTRTQIQEDIFRSLLPLSQADVEELLPQADTSVRKRTSETIISRYVEKKQFEPAIELVNQVSRFDEFPYGSASKLLTEMPAEMSGEKMSLFSQAVNSFKNHEHKGIAAGDGSLTGMIVRFGANMPPKLIMQAIDEILGQAKKSTETSSITISGEGGTASFGSEYEYQLFALLPTIERLDERRAKSLLEENQELRAKLAQYSNGLQSIDPGMGDPKAKHSGMSTSVSDSRGKGSADFQRQEEAMRKAEALVDESEKNATQAISGAAALPVSFSQRGMSPRARALEGIAQRVAKDNPGAAKQALDELRKILPDLSLQSQVQFLSGAANLYLKLGEQESAEKAIAEGFKLADKILEKDSNPDDPNKALKAWWPSVDAYRRFIEVETKISQRAAIKILTDIKDPEIRTMESIMVSRAMLGMSVKRFTIVEKTKNNNMISMYSEE